MSASVASFSKERPTLADRSEIRAGLFVVSALAVLAVATLWIVGFSPARGKRVEYEVAMKATD